MTKIEKSLQLAIAELEETLTDTSNGVWTVKFENGKPRLNAVVDKGQIVEWTGYRSNGRPFMLKKITDGQPITQYWNNTEGWVTEKAPPSSN